MLNLQIESILQSNDNRTIRLIDGTGVYSGDNTAGWGTPNTALSDINGSTTTLSLQIKITTSDFVETIYEPIDLFTILGTTPTSTDDLVFDITADKLIATETAIPLGTTDTEFPDGWYEFIYSCDHNLVGGTGTSSSTTTYKIVEGIVRNTIYDIIYTVPDINTIDPGNKYANQWYEITYPIYLWSMFHGMIANPSMGRKYKILKTLRTLEQLI